MLRTVVTTNKEIAGIASVKRLSIANIKAEKALRECAKTLRDLSPALEQCINDPEIKAKRLYHIDSADLRLNIAHALVDVENAHAKLCKNHLQFNEIADKKDIHNPGPELSETMTGGGR